MDNLAKIIFKVINASKYAEKLASVPHRILFNDIAIVYYLLRKEGDTVSGYIIDNCLADFMEYDEETLFNMAMKETKDYLGSNIVGINSFMSSRIYSDLPDFIKDNITEDDFYKEYFPEEEYLYLITNENAYFGANLILYNEVLDELAEKIDDDLYIAPSSIHEIIAAPAKKTSVEGFRIAIREANGILIESEVLSENLYYYDRKTRNLRVA